MFGGPLPIYGCTLYADDDDRAADAAYHDAAARVMECLGSAWTSRTFATGDFEQITASRPGPGPVVRVTSTPSDAVGYLVQLWVDGH